MASSSMPPPIPNDVIVEILSWLSVSSLRRFQWACKYWFDLITKDHDAAFSKLHTLHHLDEFINHNNTSLFMFKLININSYNMKCLDVLHQSSSKTPLKMGFYDLLPVVSSCAKSILLGSCNGLICIQQFINTCMFTDNYFLCNPSTREWKELPQPPKISSGFSSMPRRIDFIHGFGYDHTIQDYKVIRIAYGYDDDDHVPGIGSKLQVVNSVYTLGSNSWHTKNETIPLFEGLKNNNRSGLFANGTLHWMIFPLRSDLVKIITFDITKEEHGEIQCPEGFFAWLHLELSVFNGCLWLFHQNPRNVDVWIMKDYGVKESWTKIFTINPETLDMPVKYLKDSEILMLYGNYRLVAYDTKNNKVRYVQKIEEPLSFTFPPLPLYNVVTYVESLVSLNSGWILAPAGSTTNKRPRTEEEKT